MVGRGIWIVKFRDDEDGINLFCPITRGCRSLFLGILPTYRLIAWTNVAVAAIFLNFGVDIEILNIQGRMLLHHTALEGSLILTVLKFYSIKQPSDHSDFSGMVPLLYAVEQAGQKRHWSVFDSQRWSRSLEIHSEEWSYSPRKIATVTY